MFRVSDSASFVRASRLDEALGSGVAFRVVQLGDTVLYVDDFWFKQIKFDYLNTCCTASIEIIEFDLFISMGYMII